MRSPSSTTSTSASSSSASLTCSSSSRTRSAGVRSCVAHRRLPERFFFLRGDGGGGAAGRLFGVRRRRLPATCRRSSPTAVGDRGPAPRRRSAVGAAAVQHPVHDRHRRRLAVGGGWSHRPEPLPHDRLLHDRPEVRRDPVDEQAGREVDHEDHEDERQRQEDDPLRLVRRRRHAEPVIRRRCIDALRFEGPPARTVALRDRAGAAMHRDRIGIVRLTSYVLANRILRIHERTVPSEGPRRAQRRAPLHVLLVARRSARAPSPER